MIPADMDDISPGEIKRGLERLEKQLTDLQEDVRKRHHLLNSKLEAPLSAIAELMVRVNRTEVDINQLGQKLEATDRDHEMKIDQLEKDIVNVRLRAAQWSGAAALGAFLAGLLPMPWKKP